MTHGIRLVILIAAILVTGAGLLLAFSDTSLGSRGVLGLGVECSNDAMICPDGSAVGREGPNCEFAACPDRGNTDPSETPTNAVTVNARIGIPTEALGETIIIRSVTEDSRCPKDVQCIWAGTVKIDTTIRGGMGDGQLTLTLGETGTSEVNSFKLVSVAPAQKSGTEIRDADYVFTIEVTRRD